MNRKEYIKELEMDAFAYIYLIIELINVIGWDDKDSYTFKNGEVWHRFDPDYDVKCNQQESSNE
jgi:hypothetical protein